MSPSNPADGISQAKGNSRKILIRGWHFETMAISNIDSDAGDTATVQIGTLRTPAKLQQPPSPSDYGRLGTAFRTLCAPRCAFRPVAPHAASTRLRPLPAPLEALRAIPPPPAGSQTSTLLLHTGQATWRRTTPRRCVEDCSVERGVRGVPPWRARQNVRSYSADLVKTGSTNDRGTSGARFSRAVPAHGTPSRTASAWIAASTPLIESLGFVHAFELRRRLGRIAVPGSKRGSSLIDGECQGGEWRGVASAILRRARVLTRGPGTPLEARDSCLVGLDVLGLHALGSAALGDATTSSGTTVARRAAQCGAHAHGAEGAQGAARVDVAPVLGPEEVIKEAFLNVFCDLLNGGGWMSAERRGVRVGTGRVQVALWRAAGPRGDSCAFQGGQGVLGAAPAATGSSRELDFDSMLRAHGANKMISLDSPQQAPAAGARGAAERGDERVECAGETPMAKSSPFGYLDSYCLAYDFLQSPHSLRA
ncbi:hypothetical protein GGX14DRAFT_620093 [Mycena pura]|uniref:Uncharacterized protein n=1 Tax=Mycena pura TaxID=153505 RepID=A0AAD6VKZ5_9AGAR|nr:hypothetical protein GGX14DRAFT_620093 [Mycena pura]